MNRIIGVIGGSSVDQAAYDTAYEVGKHIAANGAILICGGLSGVMEAACKGASESGGTTIGVLPGSDTDTANDYVGIPIATGLGHGRNLIIINTAQAIIAVSGKYGTLSEIAFALQSGKKVYGLNTWDIDGIERCATPKEAVEKAIREG